MYCFVLLAMFFVVGFCLRSEIEDRFIVILLFFCVEFSLLKMWATKKCGTFFSDDLLVIVCFFGGTPLKV